MLFELKTDLGSLIGGPLFDVSIIGEPNDNGDEDCLAVLSKPGKNWNDQKCGNTQDGFICMKQGKCNIFEKKIEEGSFMCFSYQKMRRKS
mgnify:CR=1 FL=1